MTLEIWAAYAMVAEIAIVIPGPTVLLVISQAVAHGRRATLPLTTGVLCGDLIAMTLSLLGLGAVLAVSATLFAVLKWIGAAYLLYLGVKLWRANPENVDVENPAYRVASSRSLFTSACVVTATNPKGIAFFVAFLPQFVQSGSPALPQLMILGGTFLVLATINAALYSIFAGELREALNGRRARKWFSRCGGTALIGAGLFTAAMRRTA